MDIAIIGLGPAGVYLASSLASKGIDVGLFGEMPDLLPEFVSKEATVEFSLHDFALNEIKRVAEFSEDLRLEEKKIEGSVIDTRALAKDLLLKAIDYGAEVFVGSKAEVQNGRVKVTWSNRGIFLEPKLVVLEESYGRSVFGAEVARVPFNEDTIEIYRGRGMVLVPAKNTALVFGNLSFSWHKFENAAVLAIKELFVPPERSLVDGNVIRVGRAAGHANKLGWMLEDGLYYGRLLADCLIKYFEGDEKALEVYKSKRKRKVYKNNLPPNSSKEEMI